jgi:pentapeptide MXKDX repeat protein
MIAMTKRFPIFATAAVAALLLGPLGAHAQDATKDTMSPDTMTKDTMTKDSMGKESMAHDAMMADAAGGINAVDGVALKGFDPVAYFLQNKPVKGSPQFVAMYQGVTYEFASKGHQALFQQNPEKYVPRFSGFCTTAASEGVKADIDPHDFVVSDGKLNVFYSDEARDVFLKNASGVTKKAEANWPAVAKLTKVIR